MAQRCKHGQDPQSCPPCSGPSEWEGLPYADVAQTTARRFVLVLRHFEKRNQAKILQLDDNTPITTVCWNDLYWAGDDQWFADDSLMQQFGQFALRKGHLFHPTRELTTREGGAEGAAQCYGCREFLSLRRQSLGCRDCNCYVCNCGRCLCGRRGQNYKGEFFAVNSNHGVDPIQRLEFIRAARFCAEWRQSQ